MPSFLKHSGPSHAMHSSHANSGRACLPVSEHVDGKRKVLEA